jgi:radical SAM PhpK family P-methyltransferase
MKKTIDCLIIGHNEMDFSDYQGKIRKMDGNNGAYRDLNLEYTWYNNQPHTISDIFNLFYYNHHSPGNDMKPLTNGENFSAAIAYLGTYLHRKGLTFDYINSFQDDKEELIEKLIFCDFRAIAITTTFYVSIFPILEVIDLIKKYNQSAKIIVGGPFIYNQYLTQEPAFLEYLFKSVLGADFYVIDPQGEAALVELLKNLTNNSPVDHVTNVYCSTTSENKWPLIKKENNPLTGNMVDWDLFAHRVGEYVNLRTAISCPFSCAFCGFPQKTAKYQLAGTAEIEEELISLDKKETVKSAQFIDDTFNVPVKRFKEILRMLIRNKFGFKWYSHFRCQFADREMIELMKESGCEGVFLGIESGNNQVLKNMNKAANIQQYLNGIQLLKGHDIMTYGSFIIGFPGETENTVRDTIGFIKLSGLDFFRVQTWYCDPTTPIWRNRKKYQLKGSHFEWEHATMDSNQAADWVGKIFTSIEQPLWVPQYNFEFCGLFHLLHRGLDLEKIKCFLKAFKNGVKEKLTKPYQTNMSQNCIQQIKNVFEEKNCHVDDLVGQEIYMPDKFDADFNFL